MATTSADGPTGRGHVDWDLAVAPRRLRGRAAGQRARGRGVVASLRAAAERARGAGRRDRPAARPGGRSAAVLVVDRAGWIEANVDSLRAMLEPVIDTMLAKRRRTAPGRRWPARRQQGHRRRGRRAAGVPGQQGARPVRPRAPSGEPRLLLVAPNIVHAERELGGRPRTTSGSGCACTRRPTGCSSPRSRGCATTWSSSARVSRRRPWRPTPSSSARRLQQLARRPARGRCAGRRRASPSCSRPRSSARSSAGSPRDVAARGARRRRDGRGRAPGSSRPWREIRARFQQRRKRRRRRRPAAAPAARPRGQDAPVPRRRRVRARRHRRGRHRRVQRRLDLARRPCRCRREIARARGVGRGASTAEPVPDRRRDRAARSRGRRGAAPRRARGRRDLAPGALVLVACSGGADSLALAAAHRLRGAPGRAAGRRGRRRPRPAGRLRRRRRARPPRSCRELGLDPVDVRAA